MVPNICHFIAGMTPNEEFKFVYYVSVISAIKINKPKKVNYFYSYEPHGRWWEELKKIKEVEFHQVPLPTHFGEKEIIYPQHRADKLRIEILREHGGVYLDFDTICVRPYAEILKYKYAMGIEEEGKSVCNAIIFSEPNAEFLDLWAEPYEKVFEPEGWAEACVHLPSQVARDNPSKITLLEPELFYRPMYYETEKIFSDPCPVIPENLYILHLWNKFSSNFINSIKGFDWAKENSRTLYGKLLLRVC